MLIVQNELRPAEMQNAIQNLLQKGVTRVRVCSAYITLSGSQILYEGLTRAAEDLNDVDKTIVTSFDFALTEPRALQFWRAMPRCEVRVSLSSCVNRRTVLPQAAFHPKVYLFDRPDRLVGSLVGSANLTNRGMTINSEVGWLNPENDFVATDNNWAAITENTVPLTDELLAQYVAVKRRVRVLNPEVLPVPQPEIERPGAYPTFANFEGDLLTYSQMWVQSIGMQGGAATQLELPRGSHRFFGAAYREYGFERVRHIAEPVLVAGRRRWNDRPLTWHGDNAMERINLPSKINGGFSYENSLILFRRLAPNEYEFRVYPWSSDSARAYVETSRKENTIFRVGRNSPRLVGLIQ